MNLPQAYACSPFWNPLPPPSPCHPSKSSQCTSPKHPFLSLLAILWNSALRWVYLSYSPLLFASLLFSAVCKASSDKHFAFFNLFFLEMVLIIASCQCHDPLSIVLQAHCLSDLIPWIYLILLLYNHKGFDLGHTWRVYGFPYFLQLKSEFCNKEFMI